MNVLTDEQQARILALLRAGKSLRRIQAETGHRRETIASYGRRAGLLDGSVAALRVTAASAFDAHAEMIAAALARGESLRDIHDRLRREGDLHAGYGALKRYIRVHAIGRDAGRMLAA